MIGRLWCFTASSMTKKNVFKKKRMIVGGAYKTVRSHAILLNQPTKHTHTTPVNQSSWVGGAQPKKMAECFCTVNWNGHYCACATITATLANMRRIGEFDEKWDGEMIRYCAFLLVHQKTTSLGIKLLPFLESWSKKGSFLLKFNLIFFRFFWGQVSVEKNSFLEPLEVSKKLKFDFSNSIFR